MNLFFEFHGRRMKAEVMWPGDYGTINVHVIDNRIAREMPTDLLYELNENGKVSFILENPDNKKLTELQNVLNKRLQELANNS